MRKTAILSCGVALSALSFGSGARAQTDAGALEIIARITPTGARPEPVRQFTFYILTKSYSEIVKEVEEKDPIPPRDRFIDDLKVSPELRSWLKSHDTLDFTEPGFDKLLTPDDVLNVPEFLLAYQRTNSGGVTNGLPKPKYTDADKTEHPEKYEKLKQDCPASNSNWTPSTRSASGPRVLFRDREHAVFGPKRKQATARTTQCNSVNQGSGALVSRATASMARLALGPLGSSFR